MCRSPAFQHAVVCPGFFSYLVQKSNVGTVVVSIFDSQATWIIDVRMLGLFFICNVHNGHWQTSGRLIQQFNVSFVKLRAWTVILFVSQLIYLFIFLNKN